MVERLGDFMEENSNVVVLDSAQYEALVGTVQQLQTEVRTVNSSLIHATMFLILLCIFQFYGLLRRASKKGGV